LLPDADSRGPAGGHDVGDLCAALNAQLVRHRQELRHGQVFSLFYEVNRIEYVYLSCTGICLTDPDSGVQNGAYKFKNVVVFEELDALLSVFKLKS
jgi:hypothetical protein